MNDARFSSLTERLANLPLGDSPALQTFQTELGELKLLLERLQLAELAEFLGAADTMVRNMGVLDGEGYVQVKELVGTLIGVVSDAFAELHGSTAAPEMAAPAETKNHLHEVPPALAKRRPANLTLGLSGEQRSGRGLRTMSELLLGQILVDTGNVTRADIVAALKEQAINGTRIGEALVALGCATPEQVEEALRRQEDLYDNVTDAESNRSAKLIQELTLGEILVRIGGVKQAELERGVQVQRATGKRLGEALVELGLTTWERIDEAARIQRTHRADHWARESDTTKRGLGSLRLDE